MKAYLTPVTAPGVREETLAHAIESVKSKGALTFAATGTSQEGTDEETIRAIVLSSKRAGVESNVDFQALKYASYCARLSPSDILEIYKDYVKVHSASTDAKDEI